MNNRSCLIRSFFLPLDLNGTSKWLKICLSIARLNWFSLFSLAYSHRLKQSYDSGCCGLSSLATSSISSCLSASSSSRSRSLGLSSISTVPFCLRLDAARREKNPWTWLLVSHFSLSNSLLSFSSFSCRISLQIPWGSGFYPVCSPRSNLAVRYFFTFSLKLRFLPVPRVTPSPFQPIGVTEKSRIHAVVP